MAITSALYETIKNIPEEYSYEDFNGRLWDVLFMAVFAIKNNPNNDNPLFYNLILHSGKQKPDDETTLKIICGPGDDWKPAITIMKEMEN